MTIKELMENKLFDENEQVIIMYGDVNNPHKEYMGRLLNTTEELHNKKIENISAMGEHRRTQWNLNKYGWMEIWIKEE